VVISKLFFFPSWKCGNLVFFFLKMFASPCMFSWGTFQRIFVTKNNYSKNKISYFAPLCVSLGLKKLRDFTVSEGHGYPLVYLYNRLRFVR
jgi:hypothetical protein